MRLELKRVHFIPKDLEAGILYVSEEFNSAAHLCACGCGEPVKTPLGPTGWSFKASNAGATLKPSIGNWQLPCRSHYWIREGNVHWYGQWRDEEILEGRLQEEQARDAYFEQVQQSRKGGIRRVITWLQRVFNRK
jgi:hypothetical protein